MSLINEALKKAQRLRTDEVAEPSAAVYTGTPHAPRRGKSDRTGTMVLIGSGAVALVVLSVVATVFLVNGPTTPDQVAVLSPAPVNHPTPAAPAAAVPAAVAFPTPVIVDPAVTPIAGTAAPADAVIVAPTPAPSPSVISAAPAAAADAIVALPLTPVTQPAPVVPEAIAAAVVEPAPAPAPAPGEPDERVATFVESIRVTGIRSSGAESRVLMNERVYRVNDIVERTLNVRLIAASAENLTFADERGVVYVKRF